MSKLQFIELTTEARFAMQLIERWGMVDAAPDGEDKAGRSKLRLLDPIEVVDRACDTASFAMVAFTARGWLTRRDLTPEEAARAAIKEAGDE